MDVNERVEEATGVVRERREELLEIVKRARNERDDNQAFMALERWKNRTVRLLSQYISPEEGSKLETMSLTSWSYIDPLDNFFREANMYENFLTILQEEINKYPGDILAASPIAGSEVLRADNAVAPHCPIEISESLQRFRQDHPNPGKTAFVIMEFGESSAHAAIFEVIRSTLKKYGLEGVRADDKEYHDDLYWNVVTHIHGCGFGIAIFERLDTDALNPNVGLEVGFMKALDKPVCLLKDKTLDAIQSDLIGKLYKKFDPRNPNTSVPEALETWLRGKRIIG